MKIEGQKDLEISKTSTDEEDKSRFEGGSSPTCLRASSTSSRSTPIRSKKQNYFKHKEGALFFTECHTFYLPFVGHLWTAERSCQGEEKRERGTKG